MEVVVSWLADGLPAAGSDAVLTLIDAPSSHLGGGGIVRRRRRRRRKGRRRSRSRRRKERSRGGTHGTCLDFEGGAKLIGTSYWIYRGPYPMFITYRWSPRQANHTSQGTHFALVSQQMVPKERSIRQVVAIVSNSSKPHLGRSNTCGNSMDL